MVWSWVGQGGWVGEVGEGSGWGWGGAMRWGAVGAAVMFVRRGGAWVRGKLFLRLFVLDAVFIKLIT